MSSIVEEHRAESVRTHRLYLALAILAGIFIFVLPMPGKNALRTIALGLAFLIALLLQRREAAPPLPLKPAFLVWLGIATISVFYSLDPLYSLSEIKVEILYGLATYFAFYVLTTDARRFQVNLAVLLAGLATVAGSALVLVLRGRQLTEHAYIYNGVGVYTTYLLTLFPIVTLVLARGSWRRFPAFLVWAVIPLTLFTAYKTYNRMFWVALTVTAMAGVALVATKTLKRYRRRTIALGAAILLGLAAVPFVDAMKHRLVAHQSEVSEVVDRTVEVDPRPALWRFTIVQIAAHPFIGSGFGLLTFDMAYPQWQARSGVLFHAHNIFLNAGVQMGVPGMVALALVFVLLLREYARFYRAGDPDLWWLGVCGITLVVGVVTKNMTDHFFSRELGLLFWAINGMLLGLGKRMESQARSND